MNDREAMKQVARLYESVANMLKSGDPDIVKKGVKAAKEMLALCLETDDPEVFLDLTVALLVFTQAVLIREDKGLGTKAMEKEMAAVLKKYDRRD